MPRIFSLIFCILFLSNLYAETGFKKVCIKNTCVQAEIVDSFAARQRGLMFREKLADDQGMLFIFEDEGIQVFWMKNMVFPLDMIWIDTQKRIVDIRENVQPCRQTCDNITPAAEAKYVLEVKAGFVKAREIKVGDRIEF